MPTPACVTGSDWPATLTFANRDALPLLVVRVTVNEPLPVRPDAELRLNQVDDSLADHEHPAVVVTATVDTPDADGTLSAVGMMV